MKLILEIIKGSKRTINFPKNEQKKFIEKAYINFLNTQMGYIERSYYQYICQKEYYSSVKMFFLNFTSYFFIHVFITYCYIHHIIIMIIPKKQDNNKSKPNSVYFGVNMEVIPGSLKKSYNVINAKKKYILNTKDLQFFIKESLSKYPFSFYFQGKILYKIGLYSYNIIKYKPKILIATSEYSYTSSILTLYCESRNINHINVMHGERHYEITDSFFKFHKFYIWDKHYIELFIKLHACPNQFVTEVPKDFIINNEHYKNKVKEHKKVLTYYLQNQNKIEMKVINDVLSVLKGDYNIIYRLHPVYTDSSLAKEVFGIENIECSDININESILRSDILVSIQSTVLYRGHLNRKSIVIDDLSIPGYYENLVDKESILVNIPHIKLSDFLRKYNN